MLLFVLIQRRSQVTCLLLEPGFISFLYRRLCSSPDLLSLPPDHQTVGHPWLEALGKKHFSTLLALLNEHGLSYASQLPCSSPLLVLLILDQACQLGTNMTGPTLNALKIELILPGGIQHLHRFFLDMGLYANVTYHEKRITKSTMPHTPRTIHHAPRTIHRTPWTIPYPFYADVVAFIILGSSLCSHL